MDKTVVDFILPVAFIDEGKYSVKIEKYIALVMITLLPNKEVMERISDIVSFGTPKMIPDPHGVVNITKVTIEFPYLIEPYNSIKQECVKYLNRLIEVVRYQTRIYWIPSISDRDIFKYSFETINENGKVRSGFTIDHGLGLTLGITIRDESVAKSDIIQIGSQV